VLKVFFESEMLFVERNGAIEVGDMNGNVIDALEHRATPSGATKG